MGPSKKMPPFDALLMTVFLAAALMATGQARPNDHNTQWNLRHSSQVAHPVLVNSSPVSDEFPIPRFAFPASASRRQDNPWPGNNNLQDNVQPLQVKPGDTVSLVVRGRNPLEPQPFVDVSSLLAELQKANVPTASDGAYHVFLAPPDFPPPPDGQKFDVTYVGQPAQSDQPQQTRQNNPHPPLFVAPLDYSVPAGYGRIQVPTRQVKFALPAIQQLQPNQPQQRPQQQPSPQFQPPQFQPPQPQFQPSFRPIESTPVQPQLSQQQFQAPPPPQIFQQQPNPVVQQFRQPETPVVQQFRQPEAPVIQQFRQPEAPAVQQPESTSSFQPLQTAPQQPSLFDQALKELSITSVPVQALEEIPPPPPRKEPVVLAVERPAFLEPEKPAAVTVPLPTTEAATTVPTTTAPATTAPTTTAPPTVPPKQRRPSSISAEGAQQPLFPDFQSVRQRQQINRQQGNRQQINRQKTTSPSSPSAFERRPSSSSDIPSGTGGEITFGQKIRSNKVKTNAQLSPPVALSTTTSAPLVADSSSLDADPPVVERDETFQTLESQNAASSRGRIRFSRPDQNQGVTSGNAIPSEAPTTAPSLASGRGRIRITTTTAPPATTTNIPEVVTQPESITTTEKVFISTEAPEVEEEEEEEGEIKEEGEVAQTTTTTSAPTTTTVAASSSTVAAAISNAPVRNNNNVNEKPWSPYEAIQRQRQTENKDKNKEDSGSNGSAQSGGPVRTRGKTTFATSSGSGRPSGSVPIRVERPVVLRPLAPASRTTATTTIRPSIVLSGGVRSQEDFVAPVAPEFGIRAAENGGKSPINPAPSQSLLPVGRRVPEIRPASAVGSSQTTGGVVRLSRPVAVVGATTALPEPAAAEEEEEEEEEEEAAPEEADAEEEEEEEQVEEQAEEVSSTTELPSTTEPAVVALPSTTTTEQPATTQAPETTEEEKTSGNSLEDPSSVLGVSTATEVSLMYELCYRGRCVRVHE